jgi:hypothetical protein
MASTDVFSKDLSRELNQRHKCVRCGARYIEYNNIGQLQCYQKYFIQGRFWSVAADHMPAMLGDEGRPPPNVHQLKSAWILYAYTDKDSLKIDSRYAESLPDVDSRCVVLDTRAHNDRENGGDAYTLGEHVQEAWASRSENSPDELIMMGIAQAIDDEDDDSAPFSNERENGDGSVSNMKDPTRILTISRYDTYAYEELERVAWPRIRQRNLASRYYMGARCEPFHKTPLRYDIRVVARQHGIGPEDWMHDKPVECWKIRFN